MLLRAGASLAALSMMMFGCMDGMTSPAAIQAKAEPAIQQYFPMAKVKVSPENQTIAALTCVNNVSESAVAYVASYFPQTAQYHQLKQLRVAGPIIGQPSYRYFMLAFDRYAAVMDIDRDQVQVIDISGDPQWQESFARECAIRTEPVTSASYVWYGVFDLTIEENGKRRVEQGTVDTLGFWTPSEFDQMRAREIESREELIRRSVEARGSRLVHIELVKIQRSSAPARSDYQQ